MSTTPPVGSTASLDVLSKVSNRVIHIGGGIKNKFCSNEVVTARYTIWNFIPKNLFEQFQNIANVYFLGLTMLQCVPACSITGGVPTIAPPLMFVLSVNALKDGVEDWRRHQSDNEENLRITEYAGELVPGEGPDKEATLPTKTWREVEVGDMVCVRSDEPIPCDLVLMASSDPHGIAFVETANLDGETNLKMKQAQDTIVRMLNVEKDRVEACQKALKLQGELECEPPNKSLYTFEGTLGLKQGSAASGSDSKVPLGERQVVLRGSRLRNTEWTLGLVIFTGKETKIQMNNSGRQPRKVSEVERMTQKLTLMIFSLQMVLCVIGASANASFVTSESTMDLTYLNLVGDDGKRPSVMDVFGPRIGTFVLIFANFIPISLIVTVGLVKLGQVFFMHKDADMVHASFNAVPRTSDLNEELGQGEYIFSDKTGTLTCNIMEFRRFAVAGEPYGEGLTEIRRNVLRREGRQVPKDPTPPPGAPKTPNVNFVDGRLEMAMSDPQHPAFKTCGSSTCRWR
jgi:phospholipid-transporting ATPase